MMKYLGVVAVDIVSHKHRDAEEMDALYCHSLAVTDANSEHAGGLTCSRLFT